MRVEDLIVLISVALVIAFLRWNLFADEGPQKSEPLDGSVPAFFPLDVGSPGADSSPAHHHSGCDSPGTGDPASGGSCGDFGGAHHH